jgi:flagellar biosynthesis/type III secretory pathway protein FliH
MRSSPDSPCAWALPDLTKLERPGSRSDALVPGAAPDGGLVLPKFDGLPGAPTGMGLPPPPDPRDDERYQAGYAEGLRDGKAVALQQLRPLTAALEQVIDALAIARKALGPDHARSVHAIAMAVAKKIIQREIASDPSISRSLVEQALGLMPLDSPFEVRLNPQDHETFAGELDRLHAQGRKASVEWIADPSLEPGSFAIESPLRIVDGRLDVALRNLYERLNVE